MLVLRASGIGVFGYGRERPLWNKWAPYWPEEDLRAMNKNHILVDVGVVSSDHDRACEIFYQLIGGTVDYGEDHSRTCGKRPYCSLTISVFCAHYAANHCCRSQTLWSYVWEAPPSTLE